MWVCPKSLPKGADDTAFAPLAARAPGDTLILLTAGHCTATEREMSRKKIICLLIFLPSYVSAFSSFCKSY